MVLVTVLLPRAVGDVWSGGAMLAAAAEPRGAGGGRQSRACGRVLPEEAGVECFLKSLHLSWRKDIRVTRMVAFQLWAGMLRETDARAEPST